MRRQSSATDRALALVRAGQSQSAAARATGLAISTVWRACKSHSIPAQRATKEQKMKVCPRLPEIEALMHEAGQHGDTEQVEICARAMDGDEVAITECERVISDARAQCGPKS